MTITEVAYRRKWAQVKTLRHWYKQVQTRVQTTLVRHRYRHRYITGTEVIYSLTPRCVLTQHNVSQVIQAGGQSAVKFSVRFTVRLDSMENSSIPLSMLSLGQISVFLSLFVNPNAYLKHLVRFCESALLGK